MLSLFSYLHRLQEENLGHMIWDKVSCYWENVRKTLRIWEDFENLCKHIVNNIIQKIQHPPPSSKEKKEVRPLSAC
jgi:hypothetical protein